MRPSNELARQVALGGVSSYSIRKTIRGEDHENANSHCNYPNPGASSCMNGSGYTYVNRKNQNSSKHYSGERFPEIFRLAYAEFDQAVHYRTGLGH